MKRSDLPESPYVGIVSGWRPKNISAMTNLVGQATWYVPNDQVDSYKAHGAVSVVAGGSLCESRNRLLRDAFDLGCPCIQLSDDLKKIQKGVVAPDGKKIAADISFSDAVGMLSQGISSGNGKLAGAAPTANPFYWNPDKPVHSRAFIVGDFLYVAPSDPRFDESLRLKEDYDFTLQHLEMYGEVARRNDLLVSFLHRNNPGGAVNYRTSALEQQTILQLKKKWPSHIRDNPRRSDEILLKFSDSAREESPEVSVLDMFDE